MFQEIAEYAAAKLRLRGPYRKLAIVLSLIAITLAKCGEGGGSHP